MAEKLLADYNDVFADIVNVLLFNGEQLITEDELEDTNIQSHYKADDNTLHEQERDIAKLIKHKNLCISFLPNRCKCFKATLKSLLTTLSRNE